MGESILDRAAPGAWEPACILVAGATGGIGSAFCRALAEQFPQAMVVRLARDPARLEELPVKTLDLGFDLGEEALIAEAIGGIPDHMRIDWAFIATGWLHDAEHSPEKTYRALDAEHLLRAYHTNAVGPALLVKHLLPRMQTEQPAKIGILSARVGSISDNRLGGWHAYRASKAALNMLIKNYALEFARKRRGPIIVGLQPGTTDTALSAPFKRSVPEGHLQTPEYTATKLLEVMRYLEPADSGRLFDFLGLAFEP